MRLPELTDGALAGLRPRVLYSDLDGTMLGRGGSFLAGPGGEPTTEPVEHLLAARAAGLEIVPCSGRALRGLIADARLLGLSTVIAEMGCLVAYDVGLELVQLYGETPALEGETPVAAMQRSGAIDLLLARYPDSLELHTPWSAWRECTQLLRGLVDAEQAEALLARDGHGWLSFEDNGMLHRPVLGIPEGTARVYHLMPRGVSKGAAVAHDRARRSLAREECVAVGDAVADLAIAPEVGLLVLVRDAVERDDRLAERASKLDNVVVTARAMNLGWCDTVDALVRVAAPGRAR